MTTAAIVVDWRRASDTLTALRSLASMTHPPTMLICVENEATPEVTDYLRGAAPAGTRFVELSENDGFAGGVNAGMELALAGGADWVLVLNNDAVVAPSCLSRCLAEAAPDGNVGVVGPAVAFADRPDRLWYAGGHVSNLFGYTRHRALNKSTARVPASSDTDYVSGCCALISASAWRQVGPFRDDFFTYYEDVDWCVRLRAAGWRCRYVGEVLCSHAVSVSAGRRGSLELSADMAYYAARNPLRFALDTKSPVLRLTRILGVLTVWGIYNAVRLLQARSWDVVLAYEQGLTDAWRAQGGRRPQRTVSGTRR